MRDGVLERRRAIVAVFALSMVLAPATLRAGAASDLTPIAFDPNAVNVTCVATDYRGPGDDVVGPCPVESGGPNWKARADASTAPGQWTATAAVESVGSTVEADADVTMFADLTSVGTNAFSLQLDRVRTASSSTCTTCGPPPPVQLQALVVVESSLGRYTAACDLAAAQSATPVLPDRTCRVTLDNDPAPRLLVGDGPFRLTLFLGTFARIAAPAVAGSASGSSSGAVVGFRLSPTETPNRTDGDPTTPAGTVGTDSTAGEVADARGATPVASPTSPSAPAPAPGATAPLSSVTESADRAASPTRVADPEAGQVGGGLVAVAAGAALASGTALGWLRVRRPDARQ